jgi:hypothetical protein
VYRDVNRTPIEGTHKTLTLIMCVYMVPKLFSILGELDALNRTEAVNLKAHILAKVRQAFVPLPGEDAEVEIFRETAGQIMLRARKTGPEERPVMLMVTVTELRSWK